MFPILAGAVTALTLVAVPTAGAGLEAIQQQAERAAEARVHAIDTALWRIGRAEALTDAHRSAITATLEADKEAVSGIAAEVAADTDAAEARADLQRMFTDCRVYAVAIPQSLYTAAADRLTEIALPRLEAAYGRLAEAAADHPDAQDELTALRSDIDTAQASAAGLADRMLAVTPADYNADRTALADLRLELREATADVRDAVQAARDVVDALR